MLAHYKWTWSLDDIIYIIWCRYLIRSSALPKWRLISHNSFDNPQRPITVLPTQSVGGQTSNGRWRLS